MWNEKLQRNFLSTSFLRRVKKKRVNIIIIDEYFYGKQRKIKSQTFCHKEKIHYLCTLKSHYTTFVTSK